MRRRAPSQSPGARQEPQRWQPTRLPHPWDSPGKNTGVGCHFLLQCMKVKSESELAQSCPTPSDPMDCSLPGSSVHGILQARILQWVVIPFSRGSSQPRDRKLRSSALQVASLPSEPPGKPLKERIISNLCTHFLCFLTSRTEKDSSFSQRKSDLIFGMRENTVLSCPPTSFEVLADQSPMSD